MILLFGPPGAGKSVQGQMMAVRMGWKWLSTGEMFRASNDPEIIDILKSGQLIDDELTYKVFREAVAEAKKNNYPQIIVDGFPRTKAQAEWLGEHLKEINETIDVVIALEVPEGEVMERMAKRGRLEDSPETIATRMSIYRQKMYPILGNFAEQGLKIVHLDGTGTAGSVHDKIYDEIIGKVS